MKKQTVFPDIFIDPKLVKTRDPKSLCEDALRAYKMLESSDHLPETWFDVLVEVEAVLGLSGAAFPANLRRHARKKGWVISLENAIAQTREKGQADG